eukprot:36455-Alexandrium_andersonii.AAC.1
MCIRDRSLAAGSLSWAWGCGGRCDQALPGGRADEPDDTVITPSDWLQLTDESRPDLLGPSGPVRAVWAERVKDAVGDP